MVDQLVENSTFPAILSPSERKQNCKIKKWRASFEIKPETGEHYLVFKGKGFSHKELGSKKVVVKALKNYAASSEDFETHMTCSETAQTMAQSFSKIVKGFGVKVRFVEPARTAIDQRAKLTKFYKKFKKEEAVVLEERLHGEFVHFISSRCESLQNDTDIAVLEAFCHFTLQKSGGSLVVCGLKGIRKANNSEFSLTNPTIHSKNGRFGSKDKRDAGLHDFWDNHKCNRFCQLFTANSDIERGSEEY